MDKKDKNLDKLVKNKVDTNEFLEDNKDSNNFVSSHINSDKNRIDKNNVFEKSLKNITVLADISIKVTVELGKTNIKIKDLLDLHSESILVLNKHSGEPLNILVDGHVIATGELVVIEDNYGIRILDIINNSKFLSNLN